MKYYKIELFAQSHTHQYCHIFTEYLLTWWERLPFLLFYSQFVICKDRHLHIPKSNGEIADKESSNSEMGIFTYNPKTKYISEKEDRVLPKEKGIIREREYKPPDSRIRDSDEERDYLGYSYLLSRLCGNMKKDEINCRNYMLDRQGNSRDG